MAAPSPFRRRLALPWLLCTLGAFPALAQATPSQAAAAAAPTAEQLQQRIEALGTRGGARSVAELSALLEQGQPDAVTELITAQLGETASPAALQPLGQLRHHRRAAVRRLALSSLSRLPGAQVTTLVAEGLRDSNRQVRGTAARLLGERGDRTALEVLFVALERDVPEAAEALGRLAPTETLARLHAQLGQTALDAMLLGYGHLLVRRDIPQSDKLSMVGMLEETGSPTVKDFLRDMVRRVDASEDQLRRAMLESMARIAHRRGGTP